MLTKYMKLPSRHATASQLSLAHSLGPDSPSGFSPISRLHRIAPATTKHARSTTGVSEEKLSKIKEIFKRFKRQNEVIERGSFVSA